MLKDLNSFSTFCFKLISKLLYLQEDYKQLSYTLHPHAPAHMFYHIDLFFPVFSFSSAALLFLFPLLLLLLKNPLSSFLFLSLVFSLSPLYIFPKTFANYALLFHSIFPNNKDTFLCNHSTIIK